MSVAAVGNRTTHPDSAVQGACAQIPASQTRAAARKSDRERGPPADHTHTHTHNKVFIGDS